VHLFLQEAEFHLLVQNSLHIGTLSGHRFSDAE